MSRSVCTTGARVCAAALWSLVAAACVQDEIVDSDETPYWEEGDEGGGGEEQWNCYNEWRYGGRAIQPHEVQFIQGLFGQHTVCTEAEQGLRGMLDRIRVVSVSCASSPDSWNWAGTFMPDTSTIRIRDDLLPGGGSAGATTLDVLVHEWGHLLWHATVNPSRQVMYNTQNEPNAETYSRECRRDRNWSYARQTGATGGGGGGGGGDAPPGDEDGGGGCNNDSCHAECVAFTDADFGYCDGDQCWCDYLE